MFDGEHFFLSIFSVFSSLYLSLWFFFSCCNKRYWYWKLMLKQFHRKWFHLNRRQHWFWQWDLYLYFFVEHFYPLLVQLQLGKELLHTLLLFVVMAAKAIDNVYIFFMLFNVLETLTGLFHQLIIQIVLLKINYQQFVVFFSVISVHKFPPFFTKQYQKYAHFLRHGNFYL